MDPRRLFAGCVRWLGPAWLVCVACASSGHPPAAVDASEPAAVADGAVEVDTSGAVRGTPLDASADHAAPDAPPSAAEAAAIGVDTATPGFQPCPAGTPCRILPLGDSLTFGVGSAGAGGGYRVPLFRRALAAHRSVVFVGSQSNGPDAVDGVAFPRGHEGYRGFAIDTGGGREGLAPIIPRVVAAALPHVVLLLAGTNDVGATVIDPPRAPERLGALIDRVAQAAPSALIVVAQIPPSMNDATNKRIEAFNAALPAVIAARAAAGGHVLLVDGYTALAGQPSYKSTLMFNEFHPNDAGYARIADRWYEALAGFLR